MRREDFSVTPRFLAYDKGVVLGGSWEGAGHLDIKKAV